MIQDNFIQENHFHESVLEKKFYQIDGDVQRGVCHDK